MHMPRRPLRAAAGPPSAPDSICVFVSTEAGRDANYLRLVAAMSTWGSRPLPPGTTLRYVLSAHGISQLFNATRLNATLRQLTQASTSLLTSLGAASATVPKLCSSLRNDDLVVHDEADRSTFHLGRWNMSARQEWMVRTVHERYGGQCDWVLLTEDDAYVDLEAVCGAPFACWLQRACLERGRGSACPHIYRCVRLSTQSTRGQPAVVSHCSCMRASQWGAGPGDAYMVRSLS